MPLKSIEEHNNEVFRTYRNFLTGIACPLCGEEMQFTDNTVLLSAPPQKDLKCFNCGHINRCYVK